MTLLKVIFIFYIAFGNPVLSQVALRSFQDAISIIKAEIKDPKVNIFKLLDIRGDYSLYEIFEYYFPEINFLKRALADSLKNIEHFIEMHNPEKRELEKFNKETPPLITVEKGTIKGRKVRSIITGDTYFSFRGIPYGNKPKRWQRAEPASPWNGIFDATRERPPCCQISEHTLSYIGDEDCLHLNLFVNSTNAFNYPVLVFIHGGRFKTGTANSFVNNPSFMVQKGIIVVTISYRLGALGFLSSETKHASGNAGLKDVVLALKWVRKNISKFGGDCSRITVFGSSSGSGMVELLMLSPTSRRLFHRAILQSGTTVIEFGINREPRKTVFDLAKILKIDDTDIAQVMKKLERVPSKDLIKAEDRLSDNNIIVRGGILFAPNVENKMWGGRPFIKQEPEEMLKRGYFAQIPVMQSSIQEEGNMFVDMRGARDIIENVENAIPPSILNKLNGTHKEIFLKSIRDFYFNDARNEMESVRDLGGDTVFLYPFYRSTVLRFRKSKFPIYNGVFAYDGELGTKKLSSFGTIPGPSHADDLNYYIPQPSYYVVNVKPASRLVNQRMVEMAANFIKYGDPTPNITELLHVRWTPIASEKTMDYLLITDQLEMKQNIHKERMKFWDDVYKKYG